MLGISAVVAAAGCAHERVLTAGRNYTLRIADGDAQTAPAGSVLPKPLTVEVRDVAGSPVKATIVVFRVSSGNGSGSADGATLLDSMAVTDANGLARADLRLGSRAGRVEVLAFPGGVENRGVVLSATATAGAAISGFLPGSVGPGDTLSIAGSGLGGVASTVEIGGTRVKPVSGSDAQLRIVVPDCLPAGSVAVRVLAGTAWTDPKSLTYSARRRPLTLQPYQATVIGAAQVSTCVTLATDAQASYIIVPQFATRATAVTTTVARVTAGIATAAELFAGDGWMPRPARRSAQQELDGYLRDEERRIAPVAHGGDAYRPPMLALTIGSLRTFHVITALDGSTMTDATGKLQFLGEHLGIYVDTAAFPGYNDADLQGLGKLFDVDLYRTAVESFGPESDIDRNGKVLVFLTPKVNALIAANDCALKGFVSGFFWGRDLVPSLPNSNAGEIFYGMVPDPFANYSCPHAAGDTQRYLTGTFIHEMQHMISFFHHVIARGGDAEEGWLNEGLSHIAEELASKLYEARYPPPLGRSTSTQIFPDSSQPFIAPQLLNAYIYLNSTTNHSVTTYDGSGSLEERGAAWLFLRWLGDQKGDTIYRRLVQTSQQGIANIEGHTGESFAQLFGDFSVAIWADSLLGVPRTAVPSRYRFLSRNLRQLIARQATISGFPDPWPLKLFYVPAGGYAEGPLIQGTMTFGSAGPYLPSPGSIVLGFTKQDGSAFGVSDGAQIGILRVR
jgi:hypothetical protein